MNDRPKDGATSAPTKRTRRGIRLKDDEQTTAAPENPHLIHVARIARAATTEQSGSSPLAWPDLVELLSTPTVGEKDGPALIYSDIDPGRRSKDRARSVSALVLDLEAKTEKERDPDGQETGRLLATGIEPPPLPDLLDEIEGYGWRCVANTSYRHLAPEILPADVEHHRYRVVFALSRPLALGEVKPLGLYVASVLGVSECLDTSGLDPVHLHYLPRVPQDRLCHFQARAVEGEPLDVDRLLEDAKLDEAMERTARQDAARAQSTAQDGTSVIAAFNAAHDVGELLKRHGYIPKKRRRWLYSKSSSGLPGVRRLSGTGKIYSSHSGDPLADGHPHDAFDVYKILEHGGDQRAAVREAACRLGLSRATQGPDLEPRRGAQASRVNVGEGEGAFLLGENLEDSATCKTIPPSEEFSNDVHHVHHVHRADGSVGLTVSEAVACIERAIERCRDEPHALGTPEFGEAGKVVRLHAHEEWLRLRVKIRQARPSGVRMEDIDRVTRPPADPVDDSTTADELVALVQSRADLFHSEDGACFAALRETPRAVYRLDTQGFAEWLSYAYYRATETDRGPGRAASDTSIRTARTVLAGIARNDGPEEQVFLRCARLDDRYYLDLGDDSWRAVEITSAGWRIIERPPVYFWRSSTMRPLPEPTPGGDLGKLWRYANIPESARDLVTAWMLEAMRPETPFPVLELIAQQGAGKSGTQAKLRRCIDPNAVDLRAAPKSTEDLFVSAGVNWMASLNNLSHLTSNMQDAICSLATGGGFAGRTLYTNADETLIDAKRPVIINGIVPLVTAQDLTDRVIHVELPTIETYRSETELDAEFERDAPLILGGLLDLFVTTLRVLPSVRLQRPPRMADFAVLGEAMMRAQGKAADSFLQLYKENRRQSTARSLEASPVAVAIRALADAHDSHTLPVFEDTMGRLLERLSNHRESGDSWPKSPRGLGDVLRRQRPALAQIGISVDISTPGKRGVIVTIRKAQPNAGQGEHGERGERRLKTILPREKFLEAEAYLDSIDEHDPVTRREYLERLIELEQDAGFPA